MLLTFLVFLSLIVEAQLPSTSDLQRPVTSNLEERRAWLVEQSELRWEELSESQQSRILKAIEEAYLDYSQRNLAITEEIIGIQLPESWDQITWLKTDVPWVIDNNLHLWADGLSTSIPGQPKRHKLWTFRAKLEGNGNYCELELNFFNKVFRPHCLLRVINPDSCLEDSPPEFYDSSVRGTLLNNLGIAEMNGRCASNEMIVNDFGYYESLQKWFLQTGLSGALEP